MENKKHTPKKGSQLIIFFDKDKKSRQVVTPSDKFDGDWNSLAKAIIGNYNHHSWIVA